MIVYQIVIPALEVVAGAGVDDEQVVPLVFQLEIGIRIHLVVHHQVLGLVPDFQYPGVFIAFLIIAVFQVHPAGMRTQEGDDVVFSPLVVVAALDMSAQRMLAPDMVLENIADRENRGVRTGRCQTVFHQGKVTGRLILLLRGSIITDAGRQAPVSEGLFIFQVEIVGHGRKTGPVPVENPVLVIVIGGEHHVHRVRSHRLGEGVAVRERQVLPLQRHAQVVRRLLVVGTDGDGSGVRNQGVRLVFVANFKGLAGRTVNVSPRQYRKVHVALAEQQVSLQLAKAADARLDLQSVDIGRILGNDIDHAGQSHAAIQRSGRTAQDLDLFHLFQTDAEIRSRHVGRVAVQAVTVQHDEDLLLPARINAAHRDIHLFIALDVRHAGHIGGQRFLQVARTAHPDHLLRDQRHGDRRLLDGLRLLGCCRNRRRLAGAEAVHHLGETRHVIINPVVGVDREKPGHPLLGHLRLIHVQVAQGKQPVHADPVLSVEIVHRACQEGVGLFKQAQLVRLQGGLVPVRIILRMNGKGETPQKEEYE